MKQHCSQISIRAFVLLLQYAMKFQLHIITYALALQAFQSVSVDAAGKKSHSDMSSGKDGGKKGGKGT